MIIAGIIVMFCGLALFVLSVDETVAGSVIGFVVMWIGVMFVGGGLDANNQTHFGDVAHQLEQAYGSQMVLTSLSDDKIGFDLVGDNGRVNIHCDGRLTTTPANRQVVALKSLTDACADAVTAARN